MKPGALTWMFAALSLLLAVPAHAADTVYYYSSDTLHSEVVVTDQNRNVVERTHYAPYGQVLNRDLRDGPGYGGHEEDPETSLVYMQQRYYDPEAGRFLSTDPVQADGDGGSFNRYEYANDNPYRYTDPDGRVIKLADPADKKKIEKMINSRAHGVFKFNKNGDLKETSAKGNTSKYSTYYQNKLESAIKATATISVDVKSTFTDPQSGKTMSVDTDAGGGVTIGARAGGNQTVVVSGNPNTSLKNTQGGTLRDAPADILAHELVGHAIPHVVGSDTGNAVSDENKVRAQVPGGGQRAPEPWHVE